MLMSSQSSPDGLASSTHKVSPERWSEAQEWELELWKEAQTKRGWKRLVWPVAGPVLRRLDPIRASGDDWNRWWRQRFDHYRFLPQSLGDCVELGCGPYTNIRLILEGRDAGRVVCSDPLSRSYVTFRGRWLASSHASGRIEIDDHPIEECVFPAESFDLVVMINVLDHVRDADTCLRKAVEVCKPGGVFVLGQDLSDESDVARHPHDVGHPIRLRREDLEPYLDAFETLHRRDLSRDEGRAPELHYGTLVYAGRKRPSATAS
jgi:SAM-dependent methyltransferase